MEKGVQNCYTKIRYFQTLRFEQNILWHNVAHIYDHDDKNRNICKSPTEIS